MVSQLNFKNLKEHKISLNDIQLSQHLPSPSSIFVLILGRDIFFWSTSLKLKYGRKDVHSVDKNLVWKDKVWLLWGRTWQRINSSIIFALSIMEAEVVLRELLDQAKRAQKIVRALMEAEVLCIYLTKDRYFGKRSSKLIAFVNFSDLWSFLDFLTIFWPVCHQYHLIWSISSYLITIWAALVNEPILSIEVSIYHHYYYHQPHYSQS